jgi:hypothetical protein
MGGGGYSKSINNVLYYYCCDEFRKKYRKYFECFKAMLLVP